MPRGTEEKRKPQENGNIFKKIKNKRMNIRAKRQREREGGGKDAQITCVITIHERNKQNKTDIKFF